MPAYRLQDNRKIILRRLVIEGTYRHLVEGTLEFASPRILKDAARRAKEILDPATPLIILDPAIVPLPRWMLVAEFESRTAVHTTDSDFASVLYLCWFLDRINGSIGRLIRPILPKIDWNLNAEDYDITLM